ncbi:hypothetical protein D9M72_221340 [compost metagenome]
MPHVNHGKAGIGAQVRRVAPAANARKAPARRTASARTPVRAIVTRVRIAFNSLSGDSKVRRQLSLQK